MTDEAPMIDPVYTDPDVRAPGSARLVYDKSRRTIVRQERARPIENSETLYRLKIIDGDGRPYCVCGQKANLVTALDWWEQNLGSPLLRMTGVDDDVARRPIEIMISRETIAGMLLGPC